MCVSEAVQLPEHLCLTRASAPPEATLFFNFFRLSQNWPALFPYFLPSRVSFCSNSSPFRQIDHCYAFLQLSFSQLFPSHAMLLPCWFWKSLCPPVFPSNPHPMLFLLWNPFFFLPPSLSLSALAPLATSSSSFRCQGGLFHPSLPRVMLVAPSLCSHSPCSSPKVAHATFYWDF